MNWLVWLNVIVGAFNAIAFIGRPNFVSALCVLAMAVCGWLSWGKRA